MDGGFDLCLARKYKNLEAEHTKLKSKLESRPVQQPAPEPDSALISAKRIVEFARLRQQQCWPLEDDTIEQIATMIRWDAARHVPVETEEKKS